MIGMGSIEPERGHSIAETRLVPSMALSRIAWLRSRARPAARSQFHLQWKAPSWPSQSTSCSAVRCYSDKRTVRMRRIRKATAHRAQRTQHSSRRHDTCEKLPDQKKLCAKKNTVQKKQNKRMQHMLPSMIARDAKCDFPGEKETNTRTKKANSNCRFISAVIPARNALEAVLDHC